MTRGVQFCERQCANTRLPEALERFCVLTPRLDEDIETVSAIRRSRFQQVQHCVLLVIGKKREWNDETLDESGRLGR